MVIDYGGIVVGKVLAHLESIKIFVDLLFSVINSPCDGGRRQVIEVEAIPVVMLDKGFKSIYLAFCERLSAQDPVLTFVELYLGKVRTLIFSYRKRSFSD